MTKNQTWKAKLKNKVLSLVSKSNQDGNSKPNTAPHLTGIITDMISKEHPQNKFNQKELPQLKKYLRSFTYTETNAEQKVLENQKTNFIKSEVIKFIPLLSKL